ncbi:hypothetical protein QBC46DRAFT_389990 [Diplogelasinospora grovesii]|uniref:Uncharacterized protein n=1 Tax=Diplogelasinospora grovesii TaxID=303347 RepID=A0AAN6N458_9PEZI|nr:hypothetical protein QBC46DRAFT_389990 [Diplogelasinospora grovesii]
MRDAFQFKELVDKRGGRHPKRTSRPTRNGSGGAMHNVKAMNGHGGKDIFDEDDDQYANGNNNNNDNDGNDSDGSGYWDWESDGEVHSRLAQEQSVWRRAPDFWTVLGWAFRCAAQYPKRWQYWELWLEYMLDVLDMDWDDRLGYDQHEQMLKKQEAEEAETKTKPKTKKKDKDKYPMLEQSLLVAYLDDLHRERKNVVREVMRALFAYADADADVNQNNSKQGADSGVYKEIFNKETAPPVNKKERTKRKREKLMLDLEHDKFGDYYLDQNEFDLEGDGTVDLDDFDEDDEGQYEVKQEEEYGSDASTPRAYTAKSKAKANGIHRGDSDAETDASELPIPPPRRGRGRPTKARPATSAAAKQNGTRIPARGGRNAGPTIPDGVADTISIRQRLFRLLSGASYYIEDKSCAEIHDLYEMYTDRVRQLPLGAFRLFVQPHSTSLPDDIYVSFMRHLIDKFLPTSGLPDPWEVDYEAAQINGFSLAMLEQCFLPFAANKVAVEDNAKLSIVLESMCWFIYARRGCDLEVSPSLKRAVEKGIAAREERSKPRQSQRIITNRFRRNVIDDDDDDSDDDNNDNYDNTIQKEKDKTAKRALDRSARNLMVWVNYHEGTTSSI